MKNRIYIETSVISYLTARLSNDLTVAAHQRVTADWWEQRREAFDLVISNFVVLEALRGDAEAAFERMAILENLPRLAENEAVENLANLLLKERALPAKARLDALHIAVAAVHEVDYLLTWNFKHIANAEMLGQIEVICRTFGANPPRICSPLELLEKPYVQ